MQDHDGGVMTSIVGEWKPLATVDFIKTTVGPTQCVAHPSCRSTAFLLNQELGAIGIALALGDLVLPIFVDS